MSQWKMFLKGNKGRIALVSDNGEETVKLCDFYFNSDSPPEADRYIQALINHANLGNEVTSLIRKSNTLEL